MTNSIDNTDAYNTILYGMGINPKDYKPYVARPDEMAKKNKSFLDKWFDDLTPEQQYRIKNVEHNKDNVVSSGFSDMTQTTKTNGFVDDSGIGYKVDHNGFIIKGDTTKQWNNVVLNTDPVDSPSHYTQGEIEAIVYLKDNLPPEAYIGGLEWNVKKYLHRWRYKTKPLEDLKKASWYLNKLIEAMEGK